MSNNNNEVIFQVGNTYQRIPDHLAPLDRSGRNRKVHDWTVFVDVFARENADLIQRVTFNLGSSFQPSSFACSCPVQVSNGGSGGYSKWRFSTRQKAYGAVTATIAIQGAGGTRKTVKHQVKFSDNISQEGHFVEHNRPRPLPMLKVAPDQNFGIELELTAPPDRTLEQIGSTLTNKTKGRFGRIVVIRNYSEARATREVWKLVPDSSIVCNRSVPDCTTFELVSPVLTGGNGLQQASQVLDAVRQVEPQVNKSMGFHTHVDVSNLSVEQLVRVCQNFIKYEDVMDALVPPSRRTGSSECDSFFKSNRLALERMGHTSNKQRHLALESCQSIEALAALMNPNGERYYKLNLQNLVSGRQPTLEFRQHSATTNSSKVSAWVRFCIVMVNHSAKYRAPTPFREGRDLDFQFDALFQFVIKDRALREYYIGRRDDLLLEEEVACCNGCAHGSICNAHRQQNKRKQPMLAATS